MDGYTNLENIEDQILPDGYINLEHIATQTLPMATHIYEVFTIKLSQRRGRPTPPSCWYRIEPGMTDPVTGRRKSGTLRI